MNDYPIRFKPDDAPAPADPHTAGLEMMQLAQRLSEDADSLHGLLAAWDTDPLEIRRRAQTRAHEVAEAASRLRQACERVMQAKRAAGAFSFGYGER